MKAILMKGGFVADGQRGTVSRADVLVRDGRIAAVGEGLPAAGAETLDCTGMVVTAGFVDAHVHIESSMVLPSAFGEAVLPHGTTCVIADPHEVVNVAGAEGLRSFLDEAAAAPVGIFTAVPSSVPATMLDTNGAGEFLADAMREFAERPDVAGLGEVMCYYDVAERRPEIMEKIALFRDKTIDGHTAGMPADLLDAYIGAGIRNDHECTDAAGMLERYRKGMNIYIREGSAARNAEVLLRCVKERGLDTARFAFCTDDKHLATIAAEGHISYIVRMARRLGFGWGETARMVSWNPCRFYGLEDRGNVREGYVADLIVTDDACNRIVYVIKDGRLVAAEGRLTGTTGCGAAPRRDFLNTVRFREMHAADFTLPDTMKKVAIELVEGQLLTRKTPLADGEWRGLTRLATVERHGRNGNIAVCMLKGYGIRNGAVATSVSHDAHNVVCAGDNAADMAVACNRLRELGGGYTIASGGRIVGELPLPAYGLMSAENAATVAETIHRLEEQAHAMGVNRRIDAFTTLSFVALPVIPSLRLLDTGLYDVDEGRFIR